MSDKQPTSTPDSLDEADKAALKTLLRERLAGEFEDMKEARVSIDRMIAAKRVKLGL